MIYSFQVVFERTEEIWWDKHLAKEAIKCSAGTFVQGSKSVILLNMFAENLELFYYKRIISRFDIKGNETISGNAKYYANDLSYKNYLYSGF
jgi:hypothetical protein